MRDQQDFGRIAGSIRHAREATRNARGIPAEKTSRLARRRRDYKSAFHLLRVVRVRKRSGNLEPFDEQKLRNSLMFSGAGEQAVQKVLDKVRASLFDGISTAELRRMALAALRGAPGVSTRYRLKHAILMLGPEGHAFEIFVSHILAAKGYACSLNVIAKGRYIEHEIDVAAERGSERLMVECKHHAQPWHGCSIQTALYVYARFLDVRGFTAPLLTTNTKFSPQIISYARGVKLQLMGWKFPHGDSLERNIEQHGLFPLTILRSLPRHACLALMQQRLVLARDVADMDARTLARKAQFPAARAERAIAEARELAA